MQDIFLSYATADRNRLEPLVQALEAQGWTVFWDHRSIKVAQEWHAVIGTAIQQCPCVIVAWSEASVASRWVKEEALIARDRGVLYPILLDRVTMPFGFNLIQAADFTAWNGKAEHPEFVELKEQLSIRLNLHAAPKLSPEPLDKQPIPRSEPVVPQTEVLQASVQIGGGKSAWPKAWLTLAGLAIVAGVGYQWAQGDQFKLISEPEPVADAPLVLEAEAVGTVVTEETAVLESQPAVAEKTFAFEPKMVSIPAGKFMMGCVAGRDDKVGACDDDEKPAHEVSLSAFELSETEITVGQYQACVDDGGCAPPLWLQEGSQYHIKTGTDDHYKKMGKALTGGNYPIVGVSWNNAQEYVRWLSKRTGKSYHLPSEAQWEYAARAGTGTVYSWGNAIGKNKANCWRSGCGDSFEYTSPVWSFSANPWGLKDMHGNVWEWVEDCWRGNYKEASGDGSAVTDCDADASRVLRGGSWGDTPWYLRSANRNGNLPSTRYDLVGFRAARTR